MVVLLGGFNWQYLATTQSAVADLTPGPLNPLLQFWVIFALWWFLCTLQKVAKFTGKHIFICIHFIDKNTSLLKATALLNRNIIISESFRCIFL